MSNKKGKLPVRKQVKREVLRNVDLSRPMRAVIATETPVPRYDDETEQVVQEVLLMSGVRFRGGRNQLPIVDSHDSTTVRNIYGSIRDIQIDHEAGELWGTPSFASDPEAQTVATRMSEGHINDFSITAEPTQTLYIPVGQSFVTDRGAVVDGPALIHTEWTPFDASVCATGADENSTVRRSYTDLERKVTRMDEALLSQLAGMGLPEGMNDPNQVLAWVVGKLKPADEPAADVVENSEALKEDEPPPAPPPEDVERSEGEDTEKVERSVQARIQRALDADKKRRQTIQDMCTVHKIERSTADKWCNENVSVDKVRERILERMEGKQSGSSFGAEVRVTGEGIERQFRAINDALVCRAAQGGRVKAPKESADNKDRLDFQHIDMTRAAELVLRAAGINTDKMNRVDIAKVAMGSRDAIRRHRIERSALHTTGSFSSILMDAANKTLLAAYEETPTTWQLWARQAPSVPDFKEINRIRFSELSNPEMVPETKPYPERKATDEKESYRVEKFGSMFSVSWETVINDDLDAISRVPAMQGASCRRLVNTNVYAHLISNPLMSDGKNLFSDTHASGDNLGAASGVNVTGLNAGFYAMRMQKGLNSQAILNITPRFLIVPASLEASALELVNSTSYAQANGNSGVQNIYGAGGSRSLTIIGEPLLDGDSTTAWYLAADPSQVDTLEVSFLQGEESPVMEDEWDFERDIYRFKVRQTFGVKAIDWRGLYKTASA